MRRPTPSGYRLSFLRSSVLALLAAGLLGACASTPSVDVEAEVEADAQALPTSAWAQNAHIAGAGESGAWTHLRYGSQTPTRYVPMRHQGRPAILASSDAGNSTLRRVSPSGGASSS